MMEATYELVHGTNEVVQDHETNEAVQGKKDVKKTRVRKPNKKTEIKEEVQTFIAEVVSASETASISKSASISQNANVVENIQKPKARRNKKKVDANEIVQGTNEIVQGTNEIVQGTNEIVQGTNAIETKTNVVVEPTTVESTTIEHTKVENKTVEHAPVENAKGAEDIEEEESVTEDNKKTKHPKKRGRKPKGGKIITTSNVLQSDVVSEPNIILHLKCGKQDLEKPKDILTLKYDPNIENIENFQFENHKGAELNFFVISDSAAQHNTTATQSNTASPPPITQTPQPQIQPQISEPTTKKVAAIVDDSLDENSENKTIWKKIQKLSINLHNNNINDKKSACFWCTCDFDNPPIYIPKYELNDTYHCYGCFCSPECATASLFKESIDTSTKFERYHLINRIYCKIYNYTKNVKPAPEPYYTLNKYYGNLTIQEYRKLLKNDRLILIVDKPFTRSLPELHEDNDDFILNNKTIPTISNKHKMKQKPSKSTLLSENFNMSSVSKQ